MTITTPDVVVLPDGRMDRTNAARYTGYAVKTLAKKAMEGTGPKYTKRGKCWYFKEDLDAWIAAGEIRQPAPPGGASDRTDGVRSRIQLTA